MATTTGNTENPVDAPTNPRAASRAEDSRGAGVNAYLGGLLGKRRCPHQGGNSTSDSNLALISSNDEWHLEHQSSATGPDDQTRERQASTTNDQPQAKRKRLSSCTAIRPPQASEGEDCSDGQLQSHQGSVPTLKEDKSHSLQDAGKEEGSATDDDDTPEGTLVWLDHVRHQVAACQEEGDLMMARVYIQEALPRVSRAVEQGICTPSYLAQHFLAELADICYQLGDCAEGIEHYATAIQKERLTHKRSEQLLRYMEAMCRIYVELRQYSYALCVFKEIYDMQIETSGQDSLEVASTLCNMALMHYMLELYTPSLHFYQETLRISLTRLEEYNRQRLLSGDHLGHAPTLFALNKSVADSLNAMGLLYFKLKRYEEAASSFGCSLGIREKLLGPYHRDVTILWYNLAMVRVEMGDPRRAIPLYEEGLRRERVVLGDPYHPSLSSTLQYLGEIYNQLGEMDESLVCFQQALEIEKRQATLQGVGSRAYRHRNNGRTDHWGSVCRLLNVIGNIHLMQANIGSTMQCFVEAARTASVLLQARQQYIPLVVAGHMFCHLTRLHPSCASAA